MVSGHSEHRTPSIVHASHIARVHTILAYLAFGSALVLGCLFHYEKIVKNGVAGYPEEWFPSVSSAIGDWYPERSVFHILIALNSGPRFALVGLQYFLQRELHPTLSLIVLISGLIRTLSCGGWVYITSSDDHDAHDILMIAYIVCNIPWMLGGIACTPKDQALQRRRRISIASTFFVSIIPMMFFFVRHKVHRIPGAYTHYAFFEWGLIITDILFDSVAESSFREARLQIAFSANSGGSMSEKELSAALKNERTQVPEDVKNKIHAVQHTEKSDKSASNTPEIASRTIIPGALKQFIDSVRDRRTEISFMSDLYLAYIFWSIFTSLIPTLFYFSVWKLGIGGAELALLVILSPGLLGAKWFRTWASTRPGRITLHVLSLAGLVAYKLPTPTQRLLVVGFATFFACIGAVVDWHNSPSSQSMTLAFGLILSSLSKHANHSNNPVWPMLNEQSGGYNKTGIFFALLCIYELASRDYDSKEALTRPKQGKRASESTRSVVTTPWLPSSLALGSLIFSLHCFLTDPSTLIVWSWTGYPIRGPVPHLHGALTLLAQSVGLLLPILGPSATRILASPFWFLYGALCSYVLFNYKDWTGYIGGLGFAVFLMSVIPQTLQKAAAAPFVGRTYFMAFFTTVLLYLADVWTVAYAFVPGGDLLRERSDLVLLTQILLLTPTFNFSGALGMKSKPEISPRVRQCCIGALYVMSALCGLVTVYRIPMVVPQPHRPGPHIIRAGIWTVHFGIDNEGRDSQRAMRDLIRDMELDVVGLLETDLHRTAYGNRDLTRVIVEELGFHVDLGPGPNQHTWGAILLSKFPIINSTHHLLPSPHGELAPAISAFLDVFGTEVLVVVAHNGQEQDPLDRELQATELARIMNSSYPTPTIFLGYVVTKPHAPRPAPYRIMVEDGRLHDIDADDLDRWCEYIFYRGLYRTAYLRVSRGKVTDTELQVGQFVVPRFGQGVNDDTQSARYLRIHKETLDTTHWFPMQYYGNEHTGGKNGHYYHVFNTPLYYNIPEGALL